MSANLPVQDLVNTISALYQSVHRSFRSLAVELDSEALNWRPHPEANSIAILVAHTLGSEREAVRAVGGIANERVRPAEFNVVADAGELVARLNSADVELVRSISLISTANLLSMRSRNEQAPRYGLEWLLHNYGHAREHLAQAELTAQLLVRPREL